MQAVGEEHVVIRAVGPHTVTIETEREVITLDARDLVHRVTEVLRRWQPLKLDGRPAA